MSLSPAIQSATAGSERIRRFGAAKWLPLGAFIALAAAHFGLVLWYAVDMPVFDEWEYFVPGALDSPLNWQWVLTRHNEHFIPLFNLMIWAEYRITGLNL